MDPIHLCIFLKIEPAGLHRFGEDTRAGSRFNNFSIHLDLDCGRKMKKTITTSNRLGYARSCFLQPFMLCHSNQHNTSPKFIIKSKTEYVNFKYLTHSLHYGGVDMVMSWIFTGILGISLISAVIFGRGSALATATVEGAQSGIQLAISLAGSICLWCGVGKLMEKIGLTALLAKLLRPLLNRIFPSTRSDPVLAGTLSANICANLLGLGNAATPMGIQAAQRMAAKRKDSTASNELCRLIVLNTASIQLIPATVAAVRSSLGCSSPYDILPAVWVTSICSAGLGLFAAWIMGKLWKA